MRSIGRKRWVHADIDKQDKKGGTPSRQTHTSNPGKLYFRNIIRHQRNNIICVVPQPEDAAIAITSVEEVAKLEYAREDYPD